MCCKRTPDDVVCEVMVCAGAGVHFETPDATTIDFTLQMNSTVKFFRGNTQNPVRSYAVCAILLLAVQRDNGQYLDWHCVNITLRADL